MVIKKVELPPPPPPKPVVLPRPPPPPPPPPRVLATEFSTGRGSALRAQALRTTGAMLLQAQPPAIDVTVPPQYAGAIDELNAHFSRQTFSDERPEGSTAAEAIAQNALSDETATGTDGDLNCVEAAVDGQERLANGDPPVNSEIVVSGDHAVLRLDDGTYYDPTRQRLLTPAEAREFEGLDGITNDEREYLEDQGRAGAAEAGPGATPEQQLAAATLAVERAAGAEGIDEPAALDAANDTPPVDPAEAQARAEEARANIATPADADVALQRMREANAAARSAVPPLEVPYPMADSVPDAAAATRLSTADQAALFGRAVPLDPVAQVAADSAALSENPAEAAVQLEQMLATASPEYRAMLLADPRVQGLLGAFATMAPEPGTEEAYQNGVNALVRLTELVGPDQAHLITDPIAASYDLEHTYTHFLPALARASAPPEMENSLGLTLLVSLDASMHAAGKGDMASDVHHVATEAIRRLDGAFTESTSEVNQLQQELYLFLEEFGGVMTQAEQQAAIDAFMAEHAEAYERFHKLGGVLAGTMGAIQSRALGNPAVDYEGPAEVLAHHLPALGLTEAGSEFLEDAVARASAGEPSFLPIALSIGKDNNDYAAAVGELLLAATAERGAELIASADPRAAERFILGLQGMGAVFNLPDDKFSAVMQSLSAMVMDPAKTPEEALARLDRTLQEIKAILGDSRSTRMLMGIAVGMAGALGAIGIAGWADASMPDRIASLAAVAEMGVEGGILAARMWSNPVLARLAPRVLPLLGERVLPAVGIGVDIWKGYRALREGEWGRVGLHGASMAGGALMMFGGPVGVIVGGALILGAGLKLAFMDNGEARREARYNFLRDAGFSDEVAKRLAEMPEGRLAHLEAMGLTYADFVALAESDSVLLDGDVSNDRLQHLASLGFTGPQLLELARLAPAILTEESGSGFMIEFVGPFMQANGLDAAGFNAMLQSIAAAAPGEEHQATESFFYVLSGRKPQPQTEEEWIAVLSEYSAGQDGGSDPAIDAAVQYLQLPLPS